MARWPAPSSSAPPATRTAASSTAASSAPASGRPDGWPEASPDRPLRRSVRKPSPGRRSMAPQRKDSAMDRDDVIATLNDLIEVSRDGEEGFGTCAEAVKNPQLKTFFEQKAQRCALGAAQLQRKVRELGGDPERSGSTAGALHRFWINLRSTLAGMDENAILDECERGEDVARRAYRSEEHTSELQSPCNLVCR